MNEILVIEKIAKSDVIRILDGSVSLAEFNAIRPLIESRINYIVLKIAQITNVRLDWWDFSNSNEETEKSGFFDPLESQDFLQIITKSKTQKYKGEYFTIYDEFIPVEFVWTDFEGVVEHQFNDFKKQIDEKERATLSRLDNEKQRLEKIVASIKSKLTPEEFAHVQFKATNKPKK